MTVEKTEVAENNDVDVKMLIETLQNDVKKLQEENITLKSFADTTIKEKRELKAKHENEKAELDKQLEEKVNRTKEENEQLLKQYKEQNAKYMQDIENFKKKEYDNKLNSKAMDLASKLNPLNDIAAKALAKFFQERIKLDDEENVKVLDEKGNITISPVDQLVKEFGDKYAFMCKGVESTGGGSHSSAVGTQTKKLSEMTEEEKVTLYRTDNEAYQRLKNMK